MQKSESIRLKHLACFVAVAKSANAAVAGEHLAVSTTSVLEHVEALQIWLKRLLITDGDYLLSCEGCDFLPVADDILRLSSTVSSKFLDVELTWLEEFLAVAEYGTHMAAADRLGCSRYQITRHLSNLERWIGQPPFSPGKSQKLTSAGKAALLVAGQIVARLKQERRQFSADTPIWRPPSNEVRDTFVEEVVAA